MNKILKNKKGFSLVELIIVIAIMAVLIGLLAPQYLKYVERARRQKAVSNTKAIVDAVTIILTDGDAFQSTLYQDLVARLTGSDGTALPNPVQVIVSNSSQDEFAQKLVHTMNSEEPIEGTILFWFDDNADTIAFSFILESGNYVVDYNHIDENASYVYEDGNYHCRLKTAADAQAAQPQQNQG